ncbi:hypothetical protein [Roseimicrobium gellanilyticum]|nr:hypothetical protein [Roseimicrobium gellanilyticum]
MSNNDDDVVWALRDQHGKCLLTTYACTEFVAWIKFSENCVEDEVAFRRQGCTLTRHHATGPIPERLESCMLTADASAQTETSGPP